MSTWRSAPDPKCDRALLWYKPLCPKPRSTKAKAPLSGHFCVAYRRSIRNTLRPWGYMSIWKQKLGVAALLLALCAASAVQAQVVKPLEVAAKSLIAAPREGRILMLVDLQAHKKLLIEQLEPARKAAVLATALHYGTQTLQSGRFDASLNKVEVIVAMVENMDEYARPNYGGMLRLGTVTVQRTGDKFDVIEETLQVGNLK